MPGFLNPEGDEVSEEELLQLMGLGVIPDQQNLLKDQMAEANALRDKSRAGPQMRGNSRVQTAANPLEFLSSYLGDRKAGKELDSLRKQQNDLLQQQVKGRSAYYNALRRGNQPIQHIPSELDGDM
jgi:hypothetical protein